MTPEEYQEQIRQSRQINAARDADPNVQRVGKIMAAMGLDPGQMEPGRIRGGGADEYLFRKMTGYYPEGLAQGLAEWEKAPGWKVALGRMVGKKMVNQQSVDQYLGRIAQLKKDWEGDPEYMVPLQRMEEKLKDPNAVRLLEQYFNQIRRPSDLDRLPIEHVTSRIIP